MAKYTNGEIRYECKCGASLLQGEFDCKSFIKFYTCPKCARFIPGMVDGIRIHDGGNCEPR